MKNLTLCIMTTFLMLSFTATPLQASVASDPISVVAPNKVESTEAIAIRSRLAEIKAIDKSDMSFSEKKQLRKEKRALKSEYRKVGGGVYVSAGAIIVILIILILIL